MTAPTCGASGVLPAVLTYMYEQYNIEEEKNYKGVSHSRCHRKPSKNKRINKWEQNAGVRLR